MSKSSNQLALILKCQRHGERDLLVTLVTREQGRLLTLARGVRQLASSKRAQLQAGNLVHVQLVTTKGWPLLTQSQLVADASSVYTQLPALRKLLLFLEILDRLLVSEELPAPLFQKIIYIRELLLHQVSNDLIRAQLGEVLVALGYADGADTAVSVSQQVNAILDSRLRSFEYLSVRDAR